MDFARTFVALAVLMTLGAGVAHAQDDIRIVNEGGIRDQWMLADGAQLAAPGYPAQFVEQGDSVCLALGYAIQPDGSTSDFSLLKSWSSSTGSVEPVEGFWDTFAQAGANAVSEWKFKPRPEVDEPVATYTVATISFRGKDAVDANALADNCKVDDLEALVAENDAVRQRRYRAVVERDRDSMLHRAAPQREPTVTPPRPKDPAPL